MPFDGVVHAAFSQLPELVVYLGILVTQGRKFATDGHLRVIGYRLDWVVFAFLGWAVFVSLNSENANVFLSLLSIKALVRYVLIFYLVSTITWDESRYLRLRKTFIICFGIQAIIGVVQVVFGPPALEFFSPRSVEAYGMSSLAIYDRVDNLRDIFGTFRNTIGFAYSMMIGTVILVISQRKNSRLVTLAVSTIALLLAYMSGSRIVSLLMFVFLLMTFLGLERRWKAVRRWAYAAPIIFFSVFAVYIGVLSLDLNFDRTSMFFVFDPDYMEAAMNQRLGIITMLLPNVLSDPSILLGFGADKNRLAELAIQYIPNTQPVLLLIFDKIIEDVYWVALLLYFGIVGLVLWLYFMFRVFRFTSDVARTESGWVSEAGRIASVLLLLSIPLNFINQAFEVQVFAMALWTFSGIALKARRALKVQEAITAKKAA